MSVAAGTARPPRGTFLLVLPWGLDAIGGITQVVLGLYDGLESDGQLEPRILVSSWPDEVPVEQLEGGRRVTRMRLREPMGRTTLLAGLLRYLLSLPGEMRRIRALVQRHAIEVVNCHYIGSIDFTWVIAKALGVYRGQVILSMHGLDIRNLAKLQGVRHALWRWALAHADAVVACSDGLAVETVAAFQLPREQVVTIHNGVDAQRLVASAPPAAEPVAQPGRTRLLNLGTFEHKKGHDLLLRAFRAVVDRRPDAHLTIMGRSAQCTDATLQLVRELRLEQHTSIRLDVPHRDALAALGQADLFVLPSRNEAFSVALLEAGAFGKPVVATDVCGVAELVRDGQTGLCVPPEDVEALTHAILRMLDDPQLARDCARRLHELVLQRFSLTENCRKYLRLAGYAPQAANDAMPRLSAASH